MPLTPNEILLVLLQHYLLLMMLLEIDEQIIQLQARRRDRRAGRVWTKPWVLRRGRLGWSATLLRELADEDPRTYYRLLGVNLEFFNLILGRIEHKISKRDTSMRRAIPPKLRLQVLLRHMRAAMSYQDLSAEFRIGVATVCKIIKQVSVAIVEELCDEVLKCPTTVEEWLRISKNWENDTEFPHVLGAMDGTHIPIQKPIGSGSLFYNYKKFCSIVMMALVDANYKVLWCDIGAHGCCSDAQIFNYSTLKAKIESNEINFSPAKPLDDENFDLPYYIVSDEAFALDTWLMKPYSKLRCNEEENVFNYRIRRARNRASYLFNK